MIGQFDAITKHDKTKDQKHRTNKTVVIHFHCLALSVPVCASVDVSVCVCAVAQHDVG